MSKKLLTRPTPILCNGRHLPSCLQNSLLSLLRTCLLENIFLRVYKTPYLAYSEPAYWKTSSFMSTKLLTKPTPNLYTGIHLPSCLQNSLLSLLRTCILEDIFLHVYKTPYQAYFDPVYWETSSFMSTKLLTKPTPNLYTGKNLPSCLQNSLLSLLLTCILEDIFLHVYKTPY